LRLLVNVEYILIHSPTLSLPLQLRD